MNDLNKLQKFSDKIQATLYKLTGVFYIKDTNSNFIDCSQGFEKTLGVKRRDLIGKTDYDFSWKSYADTFRQNDKDTIIKKYSDTLEPIPISKKMTLSSRCLKYPIFDESQNIIGVFGRADILSSDRNLQSAINYLRHFDKKLIPYFGIEKSYHISDYNEDFNLTPREAECFFLAVRGKNSKEIGRFLKISHRTVENYIENIKEKMGVFSKSELLDKAIKLGMIEVIPKSTVFTNLSKNSSKWQDIFS